MPDTVATDTNADLQRWYCGPWCPKCGPVDTNEQRKWEDGNHFCVLCTHCLLPGLHTRCPKTRVEGLEWNPQAEWWQLIRHFDSNIAGIIKTDHIDDVHAADLLVMGVVKAAPYGISVLPPKDDGLVHVMIGTHEIMGDYGLTNLQHLYTEAPTLPEAVAIAGHRAADSEEEQE